MPRQDATLWSPDGCDCSFYVRVDETGTVIFLDHNDVQAEHARRIAAKDPTANPVLCPPARICKAHSNIGHKLDRNLLPIIQEEQARIKTAHDLSEQAGLNWNTDVHYSFDAQRVLHIKVPRGKSSMIQLGRDQSHGQGKVVIEES